MQRTISTRAISSPLGNLVAAACHGSLCLLEYEDSPKLDKELLIVSALTAGRPDGSADSLIIDSLESQLAEYFSGERRGFDLPLITAGTDFQERAWSALRTIPYGETITYAQQAKSIGNPRACRAAARADGQNRIAIIIPCHRVLGSDGSLTGYSGGLGRKRLLLDLEDRSR